jgi:hypothetical protein
VLPIAPAQLVSGQARPDDLDRRDMQEIGVHALHVGPSGPKIVSGNPSAAQVEQDQLAQGMDTDEQRMFVLILAMMLRTSV